MLSDDGNEKLQHTLISSIKLLFDRFFRVSQLKWRKIELLKKKLNEKLKTSNIFEEFHQK